MKKVLILSYGPQKRLSQEFEKLEWESDVMSPSDFYCYISDKKGYDRLYKRAEEKGQRIKAKEYSAVVPRISGAGFDYGLLVLEHLQHNLGVFSTASPFGLRMCSNKFETSQYLSQYRIRGPKQILAHGLSDYKEAIDLVGGLPCVVKLQKGSQGRGVFILRNEEDASETLRALQYTRLDMILQQKLDSGKPANDLRIWVIGAFLKDPVVIGYKRYALDGDFRSNYSLSHSGEKAKLTIEEKEMAINAARALNMHVAGVDIMRNKPENDKPYLIEVNGNPGLAGVEAITEENVAGAVAKFVVDNYSNAAFRAQDIARDSLRQTMDSVNLANGDDIQKIRIQGILRKAITDINVLTNK